MDQIQTEKILKSINGYPEAAESVSRGLHNAILGGGPAVRRLADFLHGVWLGHPLHAVLTDVTIGAWVLGAVFDWLGLADPKSRLQAPADRLTELGALSAVPTALAGVVDYSAIPRRAMTSGATHGLLNTAGLGLFLLSIGSRRAGKRGAGLFFSSLGLGVMTVSAWLGGEMVYRYDVAVNKTQHPKEPKNWKTILASDDLIEGKPTRVEVDGYPVLLLRRGGMLYAIGAVCGHEGGPLDEGTIEGECVECPWHQSVFDLRDGRVVHGPSTYAVPAYEARLLNGQVELRLAE